MILNLNAVPQIDVNSFDVRVVRKSIFSHLTSDTGLFIATKRSLWAYMSGTVDPNSSSLKFVSSLQCTVDVLSKDGSRKSVNLSYQKH